MPESCLFCDNNSGSREHLWPAWIHRSHDFGPLRMQLGAGPVEIAPDPEQTVNTVRSTCNNGWMSRLEEKNIPAIGAMFESTPAAIDAGRQKLLWAWAVMKTMVNDSEREEGPRFHTRNECLNMRISRQIPARTRVWIFALTEKHIGAFGTDFVMMDGYGKTRVDMGSVATIVAGHFGVQVVTTHVKAEFATSGVPEDPPIPVDFLEMLLSMRLGARKAVDWPPKIAFTNGGPLGIAYMMERWRRRQGCQGDKR
jgi:hypothetical protein